MSRAKIIRKNADLGKHIYQQNPYFTIDDLIEFLHELR